MSKALAILFTGTGTATVAVGGTYLVRGSLWGKQTDDSKKESAPSQTPEKLSADLGFKTFEDFKNKKGGDCVKKHFGGELDFRGTTASAESITSTDFSSEESVSQAIESCLVVNWEKTESTTTETDSSHKKWKGGFRWLWSFAKGNKGFVLFATTKESSTEKQLDLEGGIYALEKGTESEGANKWSIKKHKQLASSKKLNKDDFSSMFPVKGEAISGVTGANAKNWNFVSESGDFEYVCKKEDSDSCPITHGSENKFQGSWIWKSGGEGGNTVDKWTESAETKISALFDTDAVSLSNVFSGSTGTWTQENLVPSSSNTQ